MFSGRKVRTKVVEDSYNAVFMQELHLNALLPSMSDKIVLRVRIFSLLCFFHGMSNRSLSPCEGHG